VHSPGSRERFGDRVGAMLLDGKAQPEHAASLGTGRDT
jgi:hypothetical protein